jgi:maleylpyruvate isomerase
MILHGYFRSSAAWRVRIALNLKGLEAEMRFHHLGKGEQFQPDYLALNPQGLLPSLELNDGTVLTQSLAICEYLDERHPDPPLLPADPLARARVRAFVQAIACDIHPVQNLRVLKALKAAGQSEDETRAWARRVIEQGFDALEAIIAGSAGPFVFGERPGLADVFLVPQMGNARRFDAQMRWPRLERADAACATLPAFADARPDRQPDAEQ